MLAGRIRFATANAKDEAAALAAPRAKMEQMLPRIKAREARRDALEIGLNLEALDKVYDAQLDVVTEAAEAIYRQPAATLDGELANAGSRPPPSQTPLQRIDGEGL